MHRIGRLSHRYHLHGQHRARLDGLSRVMQTHYAEALDAVFGDDEAVYILRQVHIRMVLVDEADADALAKRWGHNLATAVIRSIARGDASTGYFMKFNNQAHFVAHYIEDVLVNGSPAKDHWYYGAFRALRELPLDAWLQCVVQDQRDVLPEVLVQLSQRRVLDTLLKRISPETLRVIWVDGLGGSPHPTVDPEQLQPLFVVTFRLVTLLQLWERERTAPDADDLMRVFFQSRTLTPDWRDRVALSDAVIDILHFAATQGWLRAARPAHIGSPQPEVRPDHAGIQQFEATYDWLDLPRILAALDRILHMQASAILGRFDRRLSPRQIALVADLERLALPSVNLTRGTDYITANALRLYAALLAAAPHWTADTWVLRMIEYLLEQWVMLNSSAGAVVPSAAESATSRAPSAVTAHSATQQPYKGPTKPRLRTGSLPTSMYNARDTETLNALFAAMDEAVEPLEGFETEAAGVFLLLRALQDLRLYTLLDRCFADAGAVMIDLARRWSGLPGDDPAFALFAPAETQKAVNAVDLFAFQTGLLRLLIGQRLLRSNNWSLHRLSVDNDTNVLIVVIDGYAVLSHSGGVDRYTDLPVLAAWSAWWEAETGTLPIVNIAADSETLLGDLAALNTGSPAFSSDDLPVALAASVTLRVWARWLGQFANSSLPYLLAQFVRRDGQLVLTGDQLHVRMPARPLDIVLNMAGYTVDLHVTQNLPYRRVHFELLRN